MHLLGGKFTRAICPGKACVLKNTDLAYTSSLSLLQGTSHIPSSRFPLHRLNVYQTLSQQDWWQRRSACDAALTSAVSVPASSSFKVSCLHQLFRFYQTFLAFTETT